MSNPTLERPAVDRYHGFSLGDVCWGYREIFEGAIEGLMREGALGPGREEVTREFFALLRKADRNCYDHALKEFLCALNPRTRWIMDVPSVFSDITDAGRLLTERKSHYGIGFFRILGEGGLGDTPARVRQVLTLVRRLLEVDGDLAFALLQGWRRLLDRLTPDEIERYVQEGLSMFVRNPPGARPFFACEGKASENIIRMLTRECRLEDVKPGLEKLTRALIGEEIEIADLGQLDSDDLFERSSRVIGLWRWLYLPSRVRHFDSIRRNRDWFRLCAVAFSALHTAKTFARLHGRPEFETVADLAGDDPARINLFTIMEYTRALGVAKRRWPGSRRLIAFAWETEFHELPPGNPAETLMRDIASESPSDPSVRELRDHALSLSNAFHTLDALDEAPARDWLDPARGLGNQPMRAFAFLPDFLYRAKVSVAPTDSLVADLKAEAKRAASKSPNPEELSPISQNSDSANDGEGNAEDSDKQSVPARFLYPEWNRNEGAYQEDWCGVVQIRDSRSNWVPPPEDMAGQALRVRRVFERLKPDLARNERRLENGDIITMERLVQYQVDRRLDPDPRVDFYEKPKVSRRDLAVLILLDISGSTGERSGASRVLELEKRATLILGQGLDSLGDRFAVAGFCSNGRENCKYYLFKDFEDSWNAEAMGRVMAAWPHDSTRIGAALRHSAWLLSRAESRRRLILLVTDGKPMDAGYDPHSRYAQFDVRMACEENDRAGIATFAISTGENTPADMEIMFPHGRFAILRDIERLPEILPLLYLRMTKI
jgi:hypothetical protein